MKWKIPHLRWWIVALLFGAMVPGVSAQESDLCKNDSIDQNSYGANVHKWNPKPHVAMGGKNVKTPNLSQDFHTWGCEFLPETVKYYFEGKLVQTVDVSKFKHSDQNIWLTTIGYKVGTNLVDNAKLPAAAEYDYVRFYEKQ